MKKGMAAILLVVGMTVGSALTMVLNPVGAAGALTGAAPSSSTHQNILQQALSTLVGNGTITQKQSDAVTQQVQNLRGKEPHGRFGPGGMGRMGGMGGFMALGRDGLTQLATLLKTTPQTLMSDLRSGQTIAQIAKANGVDVNTLIAALEADAKTEIQKQVTAGHLTQAQATKIEAGLATSITNLVNGTFGHGLGFGGPGGPGFGRFGGPATATPGATPPTTAGGSTPTTAAPAPTTAPPTTAAPTTTAPQGTTTTQG